jgi:hypothetical protein
MKQRSILGVVAAAMLAASALLFSPLGCACITASMAFRGDLLALNPSLNTSTTELSRSVVEESLSKRVGATGAEVMKSGAHGRTPCLEVSSEGIECRYYLEQSLLVERGWKVHYLLSQGKVSSVSVSIAYRLRTKVWQ